MLEEEPSTTEVLKEEELEMGLTPRLSAREGWAEVEWDWDWDCSRSLAWW